MLARLEAKVDSAIRAAQTVTDEQSRTTHAVEDMKGALEELSNEVRTLKFRVDKHGRRIRSVEETVRVQVDDGDITGRYELPPEAEIMAARRELAEMQWWKRTWVKAAGVILFFLFTTLVNWVFFKATGGRK